MSKVGTRALLVVTPGYALRTGYYLRATRDAYLAERHFREVDTIIFHGHHWRSEDGERLPWWRAIAMLRHADLVIYENVLSGLTSLIRGSKVERDIYVIHGSLAELEGYPHRSIKLPIYRAILRGLGRRVGRVMAVSEALREHLSVIHHIERAKITVVPNLPPKAFVDRMRQLWGAFSQRDVKVRLGLVPERSYICYSGNMQSWQSIDLLLSSFALLQHRDVGVDLILLTLDVDKMAQLCVQNLVDSRRVIIRCVPNSEVPDYLYASDILYIVRADNEINSVACPTKLMEYVVSGRPIIYSRGLGDADLLLRENGLGIPIDFQVEGSPAHVSAKLSNACKVASLSPEQPDFDRFELDRFAGAYLPVTKEPGH